jgi:hypothetical protein
VPVVSSKARLARIALRILDAASHILATLPASRDDDAALLHPLFCPRTACRRSRLCKRASACHANDARARDARARFQAMRSTPRIPVNSQRQNGAQ